MPSRSKKHKNTLITVEQLVDVALGTPEIGAVNFNVLHALLHVIIQQLNIQECLVEFTGHDSERMEGILLTARPGPILKVSEYMIDMNDSKPCGPQKEPVPPVMTRGNMPGKARSALMKLESSICSPKAQEQQDQDNRTGRPCDCDLRPKKHNKEKKKDVEETEKKDTTREKSELDDEELEPVVEVAGSIIIDAVTIRTQEIEQSTTKTKKSEKKEEETGQVLEKDIKKLSKKERCKEKKLEKRRKREEEAALSSAREKSEAEPSEKETEKEAGDTEKKSKKSCPCKEKEQNEVTCPDLKLKGMSSSYYGSDSEGGCQTIVRVETIGERCDTWRTRPALAHESLVKLEEKVTLLQDAFETLEKMPTNAELMKRTSGSGTCVPTPVKDMWQLYNLNKRVECCEGAIEKLASMIEDLVKETCNFREAMMVIADAVDSMECNEDTCGGAGVSPCCGAQRGQPHKNTPTTTNPFNQASEANQEITAFPVVTTNPCNAFSQSLPKTSEKSEIEMNTTEVQVSNEEGRSDDGQMGLERKAPGAISHDFFKLTTGEKFCALKENIECLMCQFQAFTDIIPLDQLAAKLCQIVTMRKQLDNLQMEWEQFLQSFSNEGVPGAVNYIVALRKDVTDINETIAKILDDRRQLEATIQSIMQEINMLKVIKADKETMEDLLAEKADAAVVNRKVSHDQFDAACDDLTKGLDEALERLIAQEAMWNEAMDELQKDLENKLDKVEIMPLKEFINKKLKGLQEKLKQLAQLRKDAEAAGAKSRILRNLNCIACDNDVIMRMENKNTSQHPSLPPSRSMRPYIAYELDQMRKALKKGPPCRSANQAEEMTVEVQKKTIGLPLSRDGAENKLNKLEHYCNRYCGGSHTITTPQQRVTRIGHFLTEFGPHAMAMLSQDGVSLQECKALDANASAIQKDTKLS